MASKKNSSAPSTDYNPNYGSSGKNTQRVPAYQLGTDNWTNANRGGGGGLGYQIGQFGSGGKNVSAPDLTNTLNTIQAQQAAMAPPSIGPGPAPANVGGNQLNQQTAQGTVDALRSMGQGRVSFPMAAAGGVPGQNSRQGYDEGGNYIDNGPGNYDIYGNALYPQQVAREAAWEGMDYTPQGPAVDIGLGVPYRTFVRADGSTFTTAVDANGNPFESANRTDMGI